MEKLTCPTCEQFIGLIGDDDTWPTSGNPCCQSTIDIAHRKTHMDEEYNNDEETPTIPQALVPFHDQLGALTPISTVEDVLEIYMAAEMHAKAMRWLKQQVEKLMIDHINANGDIEVGPVRYYVGNTKKVKAIDNSQVLNALYEKLAGDEEQVCLCMSSNPWKPGGIKKLLDDEKKFDELFTTTTVDDLKTGKPKKGLKRIDSRYN